MTCKGSYTGTVSSAAVVATAGEEQLTNGMLQALYDLEAATWKRSGAQPSPDWEQSLDTQLCPLDTDAVTWQQYFLGRALGSWHSYVALIKESETAQMPLDPEYKPYDGNCERYMEDTMPCMPYLYGRDPSYKVNSLHQAFIDQLPQTLSGASPPLLAAAELANYAYSYYTFCRFFTELSDEEVAQRSGDFASEQGYTVTFRHILVQSEEEALALLEDFAKGRKVDEPRFAVLANANSLDEGTRLDGGLYDHIARGQMAPALDAWLFDPARTAGDTAVVKTGLGYHAVYFSGREDNSATLAQRAAWLEKDTDLIRALREAMPMEVTYSAITLSEPDTSIGYAQALYPDIAHEQIPDELDFASVDVSFISLKLILPPLCGLLRSGGHVSCLVKPQFEAGREKVGKKGVVRDPAVHLEVLENFLVHAREAGFTVLINNEPERGQSHSLRLGLAACRHSDGCLFLTGDQPFVSVPTLLRLIAAWQQEPDAIWGCDYQGRFSIPSIFPAAVYGELLSQGGDVGGREVMRAHPELVRTIAAPVEEHIDSDTPSDLAAAQNRR